MKKKIFSNKKGQTGGEWFPFFISLAILLLLIWIIPLIVQGFGYEAQGITNVYVQILYLTVGVVLDVFVGLPTTLLSFVGIDLNFASSIKPDMLTRIEYLSYVSPLIIAPMVIFMFFGFLYTIFRLIRG